MEYVIAVFIMILADVISGFLKALKHGEIKSSVMKDGLISKGGEAFVVFFALIVDRFSPLINVNLGLPVLQVISVYICIMELASVIENIGAINPALSNKLKNIFHDFTHEDENGKHENIEDKN